MVKRKPARGRVSGIGGVFFKSRNPEALYRWYEKNLGLQRTKHGAVMLEWREITAPHRRHITAWGIFPIRTRYFSPTRSSFMLNYCVDDLDAVLQRLKRRGVWVDPRRMDTDYGRFAWIRDGDGNRIELWEPVE